MQHRIASLLFALLLCSPGKAPCEPTASTSLAELRKQAERGDGNAQFMLGQLYFMGWGVEHNDNEAVRWWRLAAAQGLTGAQNSIGVACQYGKGVPQDQVEAVRWYRMAAERGDSLAQYNLGQMYENGNGVAADQREAKSWYRSSCEKGYRKACESYRKLTTADY